MAKIISVKVGNSSERTTVAVASDSTLRSVLETNRVNYSTAQVHLDGALLQAGDLDKTFDAFGIESTCYLIAVVKTSNA